MRWSEVKEVRQRSGVLSARSILLGYPYIAGRILPVLSDKFCQSNDDIAHCSDDAYLEYLARRVRIEVSRKR